MKITLFGRRRRRIRSGRGALLLITDITPFAPASKISIPHGRVVFQDPSDLDEGVIELPWLPGIGETSNMMPG